jgi:hypothetical protein
MTTPAQLEEKLGEYCLQANNAERLAVERQEIFEVLEDAKKIYFSSLVESQSEKTTAEKERLALTSDEWMGWMKGYQQARKDALQAKMERNTAVRLWETARSLLSSKRIERTTGI